MAKNVTNVVVPFGSWVQLGTGPLLVELLTLANPVTVVVSEDAPAVDYTGNQFNLVFGGARATCRVTSDLAVWAKVTTVTDDGSINMVGVALPGLVTAPVPTPPTAVPNIGTVTAFAPGAAIGGLLTLSGVASGTSAFLRSIVLTFPSVQTSDMKLYLFTQAPPNSTITNGDVLALDPRDANTLLGSFTLTDPDSSLGVTVYNLRGIEQVLSGFASQVYGVLVPVADVTLTAPEDATTPILTLSLGIMS